VKEKADKTTTAEKGQDSAEYTADVTVMVTRAETMLESAPSSHNKEQIRSFIARQPAARRTPACCWLIDSRASTPMTAHCNPFIAYHSLESPKCVWLGDKRRVYAVGIVQITLDIASGLTTSRLIAQDVLHIPILHGSLPCISNLIRHGYTLAFNGTSCKIRSTASGKLIPGAHVEDSLPILNAIPSAHHARICAAYSGPGYNTLATEIKSAPAAAHAAYTAASKGSLILSHRQLGMEHADVKEPNAPHASSCANKQHHHPITKESDVTNICILHGIHEPHDITFDNDSCTIQTTASGIPIARAHVEDHSYILNDAPFAHYAHIHADHSHLDEPDKEHHQLDPTTIKCALSSPTSSRSAYMRAKKPTGYFHKSHDVKIDDNSTSAPVQIRCKPNSKTIGHILIGPASSQPIYVSIHHGVRCGHARCRFETAMLASKHVLMAEDPSPIHLHHPWIQWAVLIPTLPYGIRILSDHHTVVKSTFIHCELKENTFVKSPTLQLA
jgi:hypothetical protein